MIKPPKNLQPYIEYEPTDDGYQSEIVAPDLPEELKEEFEKFKEEVEQYQKLNPLADI